MKEMEQAEKRDKKITLNFTMEEYDLLKAEADDANIKFAVFCRKLIVDRKIRVEYREPAEMEMLEKIFDEMTRILDTDMEMLRQLRLMGDWTEDSQKTIEDQMKQLLLIRRDLEGEELHGDR